MISIILPTYNGNKHIKSAIESVRNQSFSDWELIVVDDGSTDNVGEIVRNYSDKDQRIKLIKNKGNLGIQKSLNKGLIEAQGEYIARIDDDDIWLDKDKLKKQVDFLDNNEDYVLVGTGAIVVDENKKELFKYLMPETDYKIRNRILGKNCFIHSSVMFRKDIAQKLGCYNEEEEIKHIEDYDLWLKMGLKGKFYNLPFYSVNFMINADSISNKNKKHQLIKDIKLSKQYKNYYKNYYLALFLGYLRVILFYIFKIISTLKIKNILLKFYKSI